MMSESPPVIPLKLKVEINSREHFTVLGQGERGMESYRWSAEEESRQRTGGN